MENTTKWFESSTGSGDLALTIKGLLTMLIPSLLFVSQSFGWQWSETNITNWIILISSLISTAMLVWGVMRKIAISIQEQ
jgi:glucan phosphoethanolaminetransferase (alkaline phosphatase superfamily)